MIKKECDNCGKFFEYSSSRRKNARFCSRNCLSKLTKKEQDEKRSILWNNESNEDYLKALSMKLDKFSIKKDGCWDWIGTKNFGYGVIRHRNKLIKAHRASFVVHNGAIPERMWVLHSCDTPHCTNPTHLFIGDCSDNVQDMISKGRQNTLNSRTNVLSSEEVIEIRKLLELGLSIVRISRKFNVHRSTISRIKLGKTHGN